MGTVITSSQINLPAANAFLISESFFQQEKWGKNFNIQIFPSAWKNGGKF
jgi:hypothetical protein